MAEYIKKDKLLKIKADVYDEDGHVLYAVPTGCIVAMPPADVMPVRHGRWDDIPNKYMAVASKDGSYHGHATTCSVCHEVNPNAFKTNYCPNCGSKMDGAKNE